jgi:hypothetical protein
VSRNRGLRASQEKKRRTSPGGRCGRSRRVASLDVSGIVAGCAGASGVPGSGDGARNTSSVGAAVLGSAMGSGEDMNGIS